MMTGYDNSVTAAPSLRASLQRYAPLIMSSKIFCNTNPRIRNINQRNMYLTKISHIIFSLSISSGLFSMNSSANDTVEIMGSIYMITIHTDSFEEMRDFYSNKLELDIINQDGEFIEFRSEGIRLSLTSRKSLNDFIPSKSLQNKRQGSSLGIGFKYKTNKEVDAAYNKLKSKGVEFVASPKLQSWGEYTAFFSDPDGNIHELVSY